MARMSIDDRAGRDPRIAHLAKLQGWSLREIRGCLVFEVWPLCYDRVSVHLRRLDIELASGSETLAQNMIAAGLATETRLGLRINGASAHIEYLIRAKESGRRGGKASGKSRASNGPLKGSTTDPPGSRKPLDLVPDLAPDLDLDPAMDQALAPAPGGADDIPFLAGFDGGHDDTSGPEPAWWGNPPPKEPAKKPRKRAAAMPAGWMPGPHVAPDGVDCTRELARFRDWAAAKGVTFVDWQAAWRNWLRKASDMTHARGAPARSALDVFKDIANGKV